MVLEMTTESHQVILRFGPKRLLLGLLLWRLILCGGHANPSSKIRAEEVTTRGVSARVDGWSIVGTVPEPARHRRRQLGLAPADVVGLSFGDEGAET